MKLPVLIMLSCVSSFSQELVRDFGKFPVGQTNTVLNGKLYFVGADQTYGFELWESDGTPDGTKLLKDIYPGSAPDNIGRITTIGNRLFFTAEGTSGLSNLWISDGTKNGTIEAIDIFPNLKNIYFASTMVIKAVPIPASSINGKNLLFCRSNILVFNEDFTMLKVLENGGDVSHIQVTDNQLFFRSGPLFVTNGESNSVRLALEPSLSFSALNNQIFFGKGSSLSNGELWVSDGTKTGTHIFKDIFKGRKGSTPTSFVTVGGVVFFTSDDGFHGRELWKTNGSEEGTVLVKDITPGFNGSLIWNWIDLNGKLVFTLTRKSTELWISNGTEKGTKPIGTIDGSFYYGAGGLEGITSFQIIKDNLFFSVSSGIYRFNNDGLRKVLQGKIVGFNILNGYIYAFTHGGFPRGFKLVRQKI